MLVLAERLSELRKAMKALEGRARRHKLDMAVFSISETPVWEERKYTDWDGSKCKALVEMREVTIFDNAPLKMQGWEFIARIERLEAGYLVQARPGFENRVPHDLKAGACEHCNHDRARPAPSQSAPRPWQGCHSLGSRGGS